MSPAEPPRWTRDDFLWLASSSGRRTLDEASRVLDEAADRLQQVSRLRKRWTAEQTALLLKQSELRRRAAKKFTRAAAMLFTRKGLQQATSEAIAHFKAGRFPRHAVDDLGCGIGGDALALAGRGPVRAVEWDGPTAICARQNAEVYQRPMEVVETDAASWVIPADRWIHADPDRRPDGQRTTSLAWVAPPAEVLERWLTAARGLALKVAPATEPPSSWLPQVERQWIGEEEECKQQMPWAGELTERPGRRSVVVLDRQGAVLGSLVGELRRCDPPAIEAVQQFLAEPHPAVRAAALVPQLAQPLGWTAVGSKSIYCSSPQPTPSALCRWFEVLEIVPVRSEAVHTALRRAEAGHWEIKCRGKSIDAAHLVRRFRPAGENRIVVVVTTIGRSRRFAA